VEDGRLRPSRQARVETGASPVRAEQSSAGLWVVKVASVCVSYFPVHFQLSPSTLPSTASSPPNITTW